MNKSKTILHSIVQVLAMAIIFSVLIFSRKSNLSLDWIAETVAIFSIILVSALSITISSSRFFNRNPSTLVVSLLGFPGSGKTVYLTVLFNEILINSQNHYNIYGSETVDRISEDYRILQNGYWLPPTPIEGAFYYRATTPKYKIEICDYAGEFFKNELKENLNFIHRTKYFKYVINSDIVFLAIDLEKVVNDDFEYINDIESSFISALHVLHEERNINIKGKMKFPVALLFLKTDCMTDNDMSEGKVLRIFNRLITYCENHCKFFECFFVASLSTRELSNKVPPKDIEPYNVIEPLQWSIAKVKRLF